MLWSLDCSDKWRKKGGGRAQTSGCPRKARPPLATRHESRRQTQTLLTIPVGILGMTERRIAASVRCFFDLGRRLRPLAEFGVADSCADTKSRSFRRRRAVHVR